MAEDTITNSTVDSNEGIYKSDYQVQNGQKQFPGIAGNNVISYPLWSKRSVRRRHEQQSCDSSYEKSQNTVSQVFHEFGDTTSIQGISFAKKAKSPVMKLFWILLITAGIIVSILQSHNLYIKFTAFETNSVVSISYASLDFPSVTLCNQNALRASKIIEFGNAQLKQFLQEVKPRSDYMVPAPSETGSGTASGNQVNSRRKRQLKMPKLPSDNLPDFNPESTTKTTTSQPTSVSDKKESRVTTPSDGPATEKLYSPRTSTTNNSNQGSSTDSSETTSEKPPDTTTSQDGYSEDSDDDSRNFFPSGYAPTGFPEDMEFHDHDTLISDKDTSGYLLLKVIFEELLARINRKKRQQLSHSLNEMMLSCSYDGKVCGPRNFSTSIHPEFGLCWTFNSKDLLDKPLVSIQSGANYGLSLMLNIQSYDYLSGITDSRGVRVDIHDFSTMAFPAEVGLSVAPGTETSVSLRKINQTRLGGKYGDCMDEGQFENYYSDYHYSLKGCINTCLDRNISAICGCYRRTRSHYYNQQDLQTLHRCAKADKECITPLIKAFEAGDIDCDCRQACHTVDYGVEVSNDVWPDDSLWWALVDASCARNGDQCNAMRDVPVSARERYLLKNFLHLKIYYRDLNVENINEDPAYDLFQFGADFGGVVGLWLGASALTVFEIVDLIFHFFMYICCCKKKQMKVKEENEFSEKSLPMDLNQQIKLSNYLPKYHSNFSFGSQNDLDMNW